MTRHVPLRFESVSVILPVLDETDSLRETVETILRDCDPDIREFLVVVCARTTPQSLAVCDALKARLGDRMKIIRQTLPYLGGATRDAFDEARGSSHVLMMASDLETPPERVAAFLAEAKRRPEALITGSRWLKGGGFENYDPLKLVLNWLFQHIFRLLYWTKLGDLTYGYKTLSREIIKTIPWQGTLHEMFIETTVRPLRRGYRIEQVPTIWIGRREGESKNQFLRNFRYVRTALQTLWNK